MAGELKILADLVGEDAVLGVLEETRCEEYQQ
jgi:hypothetical protein